MTAARPKVKLPILVIGLGFTGLLLVVLFSGFGNDPKRPVESALIDLPAPGFSTETLDGEEVSLTGLGGKPTVLNFWSTWCGPCKFEHPHLQAAARQNPDVAFYGVIYQDELPQVRSFLRKKPSAYPNLRDDKGRMAIDYGVTGVPETYFIDRHGTVVYKHAGPLDQYMIGSVLQELRRR